MNKVSFIRNRSLFDFENEINKFCETHDVIATQFLDMYEEGFTVAVWYRVEEEGKPIKM